MTLNDQGHLDEAVKAFWAVKRIKNQDIQAFGKSEGEGDAD